MNWRPIRGWTKPLHERGVKADSMPERLLIGPGSPPSIDPVYPELSPSPEPCPISGGQSLGKPLPDLSRQGQSLCEGPFSVSCRKSKPFKPSDAVGFDEKSPKCPRHQDFNGLMFSHLHPAVWAAVTFLPEVDHDTLCSSCCWLQLAPDPDLSDHHCCCGSDYTCNSLGNGRS